MLKKQLKKIEYQLQRRSFSISQQIYFSQRLSLLLDSGVSMVESLYIMSNMEKNAGRRVVYGELIANVEKGTALGKSFIKEKIKFDHLLINLIQNGELTGKLSETLRVASHYLDRRRDIKKKILNSLMYPSVIVIATTLMTLFLILYIFPKIIPLLSSLDIELPLITRIVQGIYYISISYGVWLIIVLSVIISLFYFLVKKFRPVRYRLHRLILSVPYISKYIKLYLTTINCGISSILINSGKSVHEILDFASKSSNNLIYKKIFYEMSIETQRGVALSSSLNNYKKYFPVLFKEMSFIGEKTGSLGTMLSHCSNIFEQEVEDVLKKVSTLIEPFLMILMGLVVGSVALSIILPVYEITNHLTK